MAEHSTPNEQRALRTAWAALGGDAGLCDAVRVTSGPALPSVFDVSALATGAVAAATLAAAELLAARNREGLREAHVDAHHAAAAFGCERHLRALGWTLPPVWDPIAGDYAASDTWIRLHTNYTSHRDAALSVLRCHPTREAVAAAVSGWDAHTLEGAVVAAGGCAAAMRSVAEWAEHPAGRAVAAAPLVARTPPLSRDAAHRPPLPGATLPLSGVRVLDLTRVIAGPVATRLLAGWGAQVLRLDPPGFEEVAALLPETTAGKRCAAVDLTDPAGEATFRALVAAADVVVLGTRPAAHVAGLVDTALAEQAQVVVVRHNAYGWASAGGAATTDVARSWQGRRGFDSLLQLSTGIAAAGMDAAGAARPVPLPVQALDHATGFLEAAAALRGLTERLHTGWGGEVRLSLAATAQLLVDLGPGPGLGEAALQPLPAFLEEASTAWGPVARVRLPGRVGSLTPSLALPAGPLGRDAARWL